MTTKRRASELELPIIDVPAAPPYIEPPTMARAVMRGQPGSCRALVKVYDPDHGLLALRTAKLFHTARRQHIVGCMFSVTGSSDHPDPVYVDEDTAISLLIGFLRAPDPLAFAMVALGLQP